MEIYWNDNNILKNSFKSSDPNIDKFKSFLSGRGFKDDKINKLEQQIFKSTN